MLSWQKNVKNRGKLRNKAGNPLKNNKQAGMICAALIKQGDTGKGDYLTMATKKKIAEEIKEEVKAVEAKAENAVKSAAKKTAAKVTADKAAAKKAAAATKAKVEKKVAAKVADVKEAKAAKSAGKVNLVFQSIMGGAVTPDQIVAKLPKETTDAYIKIEENKIYFVLKNGETGSVEIW